MHKRKMDILNVTVISGIFKFNSVFITLSTH